MSSSTNRRQSRKKRVDESVQEALERSLQHAGLALAEGVLSSRALLDVASLGISGEPAEDQPHLAEFARTLDQIADALSGKSPSLRTAFLGVILDAVESEIARWEVRSSSDEDARSVLRAFIGLREILWEMGIRRDPPASRGGERAKTRRGANADASSKEMKWGRKSSARVDPPQRRTPGTSAKRRAARVQRIKIDD